MSVLSETRRKMRVYKKAMEDLFEVTRQMPGGCEVGNGGVCMNPDMFYHKALALTITSRAKREAGGK